jgi:hypothetical protein
MSERAESAPSPALSLVYDARMSDDKARETFRDIRKVRTLGPTHDHPHRDAEVNQALALGWLLLSVSAGEGGPTFVVGWARDGEAPKTAIEQENEALYGPEDQF